MDFPDPKDFLSVGYCDNTDIEEDAKKHIISKMDAKYLAAKWEEFLQQQEEWTGDTLYEKGVNFFEGCIFEILDEYEEQE